MKFYFGLPGDSRRKVLRKSLRRCTCHRRPFIGCLYNPEYITKYCVFVKCKCGRSTHFFLSRFEDLESAESAAIGEWNHFMHPDDTIRVIDGELYVLERF